MTTHLTSRLQEHARDAGTPDVDLAAVLTAGTRRRRRRALLTSAGVATACAAVAGTALLLPQATDQRRTDEQLPTSSFGRTPALWAVDSTIHVDGRAIEVPGRGGVFNLVRTSGGIVYVDEAGAVWSLTEDAEPERVGSTAPTRKYLHTDGRRVAWVAPPAEGSDDERLEVVVLDHRSPTLDQVRMPLDLAGDTEDRALHLAGLDSGVVRVVKHGTDLLSRDSTQVGDHAVEEVRGDPLYVLSDVRAGTVLSAHVTQDGPPLEVRVGTGIGVGRAVDLPGPTALNTEATLALGVNTADQVRVLDLRDHSVRDVPLSDPVQVGYQWFDADTFLALTVPGDPGSEYADDEAPVDLLSCDVPADAGPVRCTPVADAIGTWSDGFVLPTGTWSA